uniref:NADH-ubiquinone oxidoreductase chain 6 n=1 Tax=Trigonopterus sp. 5 AH-2016 TaxID=1903839 RepID=A0A343C473_9CUCU|nr:NADH dehydrogenase subunit 6 [Trigonopterus sp. 5 AH-2016]
MLALSWVSSIIMMNMNHPMSLGSILLLQTILIALASGHIYLNFWFSYILFLIMIGGMLVMFIYMTSIASNEKFKIPKYSEILMALTLTVLLSSLLYMDSFYSLQFSSLILSLPSNLHIVNLNMNKYFNLPSMTIMIFLMIYLLITLIAIVKITKNTKGTLRQK